ncbi:AAA family ATPase isoform A [Micractinium conductrix]|uniref:AAA family ATPase isoform A n=1 Tax=Micractinium conductrix TaxID=554055 RepID=A0A2P6V4V0_9CHLO|nr:AAA family ATPase isoform A [Micractinium conductrix]|eukprot:PSC69109.1 AAA family ATPase isoform A [Micractinium conductrix]
MTEKGVSFEGGLGEALNATTSGAPKAAFRTTPSAAELAYSEAEGYADRGLAEHKTGHHLEEHWKKGYGGLRPEGEDEEEEAQRLRELQQRSSPGLVQRAVGAAVSAAAAVAAAVLPESVQAMLPAALKPSAFKSSPSAAELAYSEVEGYADRGLAEHKTPGHHLEGHWKKGYGGLRPEGEDWEEEQQRLRELEARQAGGGMVQRAKETVASAAATASEKAGGMLQAAKEAAGMESKQQ